MNPYIIGPYRESDSGKFWGRTKEIDGIYRSFLLHDYLVCYANSGEGKSSIINAGLFPKLRKNKYFPINIRFQFNEDDLSTLDFDKIINSAIDNEIKEFPKECSIVSSLIVEADNNKLNSWQKDLINSYVWLRLRYSTLEIRSDAGIMEKYIPVLVFDQFEEVFTNPKTEIWTKKFFKWLEDLSTDVCPDEILYKFQEGIKNDIKEDDYPIIRSVKKFKAIFSLRSEYVGNIDYWGLQHYYIPDLKNNRYFLKPLTPEGAIEVVMQPNGVKITKEECKNLIDACSENIDYVREDMPCIPASILSIVCHELYEHTEQQRIIILKSLYNDKNATVEKILEDYYLKLLKQCGINDDKIRDAFENALVDDKGNRKRIGTNHKDFSLITHEQISKLKDKNLLRVISKASDELGEVVELPHDKFCRFIMNHKSKRFAEIERKNATLKEWILFAVFAAIFGITSICIHSSIIELLKPAINHSILGSDVALCPEFVKFLKGEAVSEGYNEAFAAFFSLCLSVLALPILITCFTKKWTKCTILLAFFSTAISSLLSCRIDSFADGHTGTLTLLTLLISLGIIIYSVINRMKKDKSVISAWPLWAGYFLFSFYLFWEFVYSLIIGVNEPKDSFFFIVLLPFLLFIFSLSYNNMISESRKNGFWLFKAAIYVLLLCLLAINNFYSYLSDAKYDFIWVIGILVCCIILIINLLGRITNTHKRRFSIALNIVSLIIIYILNLGYNPLSINYERVAKVANWRAIYVKDNKSNLYGVYNPINGDTIISCVLSYCDYIQERPGKQGGTAEIKTTIFKTKPTVGLNEKNKNSDGSFCWDNDSTIVSITTAPTLEQHITKIISKDSVKSLKLFQSLKTLEGKIDFQSAILFKEIREACIKYAYNAKPYSLDEITSLKVLDSLQNIYLENQLQGLSLNQQDVIRATRKKIEVLEDDDLKNFFSAITRNLYLYILKDRILKKDFVSVFTLARMHVLLYFTSVPAMSLTYTISNSYNITADKDTHLSRKGEEGEFTVCSEDIIENKCFAWHNLFISLCLMDNRMHAEDFTRLIHNDLNRRLEYYREYCRKYNPILDKLNTNLKQISTKQEELLIKVKKGEYAINDLVELFNLKKKAKGEELKNIINEQITDIDNILRDWDIDRSITSVDTSFNNFCEKIYKTLYTIMDERPEGIYNAAFENICTNLIIMQLMRGHDVENQINKLISMDKKKDDFRNTIIEIDSISRNSINRIREQLEKNLARTNQIQKLIND